MTTMETQAPAVPAADTQADSGAIPHAAPKADGVAPLRGNSAQLLQMVLFVAGAVLLPGGLVVIGLGWYGTAHTPYEYDQNAYLISGGILGLGITLVGGFLYFGSWLARLAVDQKASSLQVAESLSKLADAVLASNAALEVPAAPVTAKRASRATAAPARSAGSSLVVAGNGTTLRVTARG